MQNRHHPDKSAYTLFRKGSLALSKIESAGMRIDTKYVDKQVKKINRLEVKLKEELEADRAWKLWNKRFKSQTKMGNRQQLREVLVKDLGFHIPKKLDHGEEKESADKDSLADLDYPFVATYVRREGLLKCQSTYLSAILREGYNGYLHPSFSLNLVISYRSSSSNPNVQNWPTRNEEQKKIVRGCIISRFGKRGQIVESDFKSIEVSVGACYHKDRQMIKYLTDKSTDMHRDMAMECYLLKDWQVSDRTRYCAKNKFVFPAFYGSYFPQLARPLWMAMTRENLHLRADKNDDKYKPTGISMAKHLRRQGFKEMGLCDPDREVREGTFEAHIKEVERRFWKERFKGYDNWKTEFYEEYLRTAGFKSYTGFAWNGYFQRNAVLNYIIQGSAFHCLLFCLTRIIDEMERMRMRSKIIGQIHDSILADIHIKEKDDYLELVERVTMTELSDHWPWLKIVPITTETEFSPPGMSWYHKGKAA